MTDLGFDKMCRTCMAQTPVLFSILDKQPGSNEDDSTIGGMLRMFTTIQAAPADGLPQRVCMQCLSEINRVVSFKLKCERSESTLQSCLQQLTVSTSTKTHQPVPSPTTTADNVPKSPVKHDPAADVEQSEVNKEEQQPSTSVELIDFEMIYQCPICDEIFDTNTVLDEHMAWQHPDEDMEKSSVSLDDDDAGKQAGSISAAQNDEDDDGVDDTKPTDTYSSDVVDQSGHNELDDEEEGHAEYIDEAELDQSSQNDADEAELDQSSHKDADDETHNEQEDVFDENDAKPERTVAKQLTQDNRTVLTSSDGQTAPYKCNLCNATYVHERSLLLHQKSNKCTQKSFECTICQRVYLHRRNLRAHIDEHHSAVARQRTCTDCQRRFGSAAALAEHRSAGTCGNRSYVCSHCQRGFTMLSSLRDHMRTHNGERPFLCSICGKDFTQKTNLRQHMLRHSQTKQFKCTHCPKSFVSKGEMGQHMHTHTGAHPFACETCAASFTTSSSLVKHRRIHTGERPYACEYCPMRFAALCTLKNHRRTHTGEKPYTCEHCGKSFAQRSDCVTHQRLHEASPPVPLQCEQCERTFLRIGALRSHVLYSHGKKMSTPAPELGEEESLEIQVLDDNECLS